MHTIYLSNYNICTKNTWVNKWLSFNAKCAILQLYHGKDNILDEMMMMSDLY